MPGMTRPLVSLCHRSKCVTVDAAECRRRLSV